MLVPVPGGVNARVHEQTMNTRTKKRPGPKGPDLHFRLTSDFDLRTSEGQSETELHRPRRVGEVRARRRLTELRAALIERVGSVVLPVEQVEHFEAAGEIDLAAQRNALEKARLDPVNRLSYEAIARDDRAIQP